MKYQLIYADPPWQYRDTCDAGNRGAAHKYPVMGLALNVPEECLPELRQAYKDRTTLRKKEVKARR